MSKKKLIAQLEAEGEAAQAKRIAEVEAITKKKHHLNRRGWSTIPRREGEGVRRVTPGEIL